MAAEGGNQSPEQENRLLGYADRKQTFTLRVSVGLPLPHSHPLHPKPTTPGAIYNGQSTYRPTLTSFGLCGEQMEENHLEEVQIPHRRSQWSGSNSDRWEWSADGLVVEPLQRSLILGRRSRSDGEKWELDGGNFLERDECCETPDRNPSKPGRLN